MSIFKLHIHSFLWLLTANIFFPFSLFAQEIPFVQLKEFEISDSQFDTYPGIRYFKLDSTFSSLYVSLPLTIALELQTGAYVRANGNAASATISIRGTSGDKTNVLWNGFHINSGSLGLFDFSLLPNNHAQNLQIALGSASSIFGNASMGATIYIEHQPKFNSFWNVNTKQDIGSYSFYANSTNLEWNTDKISSQTYFTWQQAENNFLYQDKSLPESPWLPMNQAGYHQITATECLHAKLNPKNQLALLINYNQQFRQIPPAIGMALNNAVQFDRNIRIAFIGKHILGKSSHLFTQWGGGYFMDQIMYSDNNIADSSWVHQPQFYFVQKWGGWKKISIEWGGHYQLFIPIIRQYSDNIFEHRVSLFAQATWKPLNFLSLFYSIRQQFIPGFLPPINGSFSSSWNLFNKNHHSISFRAVFNNGYRVPTLNDRYWTPGGNPNLLPELSWNVEGGVKYQWKKTRSVLSFDVNGFCMWVNDWIIWTPQPAGYWSPSNIKFVRLAGIESSASFTSLINQDFLWKLSTHYNLTFAHDLTFPDVKQLIYVPIHTANFSAHLFYKGFYSLLSSKFCSQRFIRADNSLSLPPYIVVDASLGRKFNTRYFNFSIDCIIRNLTNTQYESIENRPLPGIQFLASIAIQFNKSNLLTIKNQ